MGVKRVTYPTEVRMPFKGCRPLRQPLPGPNPAAREFWGSLPMMRVMDIPGHAPRPTRPPHPDHRHVAPHRRDAGLARASRVTRWTLAGGLAVTGGFAAAAVAQPSHGSSSAAGSSGAVLAPVTTAPLTTAPSTTAPSTSTGQASETQATQPPTTTSSTSGWSATPATPTTPPTTAQPTTTLPPPPPPTTPPVVSSGS